MAYGQFVDYEPLPDLPGAYSFQTASGKPVTFGGPEAENLKARLDAAKAATATAGDNAAGGFDQVGNYGSANAPPSPEQLQSFRDKLQPPGAPAPIFASAAGGPTRAPGGQLGYGLSVSPQGTIQKFVPGSAGVSKAQLQKADENAVAVRRGENEVVQAGTPQDQAYLDARAEGNVDERLAAQAQGDRETAAAQAESDLAQKQFDQQQKLAGEEAARQADLQTKFAREQQLHDNAVNEYTSSKVDPKRIFANPVSKIASMLAAAGGAYAAIMTKTPNFAQQIIDSSIERDVRAQEAAIRLKGDKADNLLQNLRSTGLSLEQSRAAAKQIQLQKTQAEVGALRAKNAVPALQSHYDNIDLALQKSLLEANEQSRLAAVDKVTRSTAKGFEHERAATAGGFRDVGDQLGTAAKVQGLQKGETEIAKDRAAAEKGPPASPEKRQAMSAIADASTLEKSLHGYADDYVPQTRENMNIIKGGASDALDSVLGKGAGARNVLDEKDRRGMQDFANAQQTLSALQSVLGGQGALSGGERDAALAGLSPGATMGEVKRAVSMLRTRAETKLQAADATGEAGGTVVTK